jgi:hypothetical protein
MRSTAPLLIVSLLSACASHGAPVVDADERARAHLEQFERFERWVARTAGGSPALPDRAALRETIFAPVRSADEVLGAWVHLPGRPAYDLALLDDSAEPSLQGALQLHDASDAAPPWRARARSDLSVVVQRPCAFQRASARARKREHVREVDCVVLGREARTASGALRVVAVFAEIEH